jgi:hypothetical protein
VLEAQHGEQALRGARAAHEVVRALDAHAGQRGQVVAAREDAHVQHHLGAPVAQGELLAGGQARQRDLLAAPVALHLEAGARHGVGHHVRVLADHRSDDALPRQVRQLRVRLVGGHDEGHAALTQQGDEAVRELRGDVHGA